MGGMNLLQQCLLSCQRKCRIHGAADDLFAPADPEQHDQLGAVFTADKKMLTGPDASLLQLLLQRIQTGIQLLVAEGHAGIP